MRRVALFANGKVGIDIAHYLRREDEVILLFVSGQYPEIDAEILAVFGGQESLRTYTGDLRSELNSFIQLIQDLEIDTIITVYWPFLVPIEVIRLCDLTVNFHPALLPLNRGWYPHVHNILDGSPAGVTLHELTENADEGRIWAQERVEVYAWDCAGDLYSRLQKKITELFLENWVLIKSRQLKPRQQLTENSSYHSKREISSLDAIDLQRPTTARELINQLRARTFGETGYAYFEESGAKIRIRIILSKIENVNGA